MKILFFIAALAGAVYLIMQTPAGNAWLEQSEPELDIRQEIQKVQQVSTQFAQRLNQKQQAQISQLESRIAELENQLITVTSPQGLALDSPAPVVTTSDNNLQRKRQARLQDIVQKMEISSLQALVD